MSRDTALLDANILYPAPMRDLFLQLAVMGLFQAKWSEEIHREWINALMRKEPRRDRVALERTRDLMNQATRDCLVINYTAVIPALTLPDPNDRHVLAAAIIGRCDVIVTQNQRDFLRNTLDPYGIEALHPDEFLSNHLEREPDLFCAALHRVRARLRNPPYSAQDYLANLTQQGLVVTAAAMKQFQELI